MQQVLGAAIQRGRSHDVGARTHQRGNGQVQRRLAAGRGNGANAAFKRRHPLLQHRVGRVADAGVNMPGALQVEQAGGVVAGLEHERGGKVNRHSTRSGGGVGGGACVQCERVKTRV